MCFHDRSVAVIGAAGGIGSALCRSLAVEGARLTLIGRDRQRLETLAAETGGVAVVCDAAVMEDLDSVLAAVEDLYGIVNCAGSLLLKPAHATTPAGPAPMTTMSITSRSSTFRTWSTRAVRLDMF